MITYRKRIWGKVVAPLAQVKNRYLSPLNPFVYQLFHTFLRAREEVTFHSQSWQSFLFRLAPED